MIPVFAVILLIGQTPICINQPASNKAKIVGIDNSKEQLDIFKFVVEKVNCEVIAKASAGHLICFVKIYTKQNKFFKGLP